MTEQDRPQDPMIYNEVTGTNPEVRLLPTRVYDLSNIDTKLDTLSIISSEDLESGDVIIGLNSWADVVHIVEILTYKIVTANDPDTNTNHNLLNRIDLEKVIQNRDEKMGFIGSSRNFQITILPTDLSYVNKTKNHPRNPDLARSFELKRIITSDTLVGKRKPVTDSCTISLTDRGIKPVLDAYDEETGKSIHNYKGDISISGIDNAALDAISKTRSSATSFGKSVGKGRRGTGPRNPL